LLTLAICLHMAAFAMRCSITRWPPVTNMYETLIWVALVAAVLSLVLFLIRRRDSVLLAGSSVALLAALVADRMPPEFGRAIASLTPILQSRLWLTIHVITIVSSYGAFALALILGDLLLLHFLRRDPDAQFAAEQAAVIDRLIQIGVLLITTGIILGGLWAEQSWGRFWGWDPKEVWALVVLLVYLLLVHGRFAGWLNSFGMAMGAVLSFSAVIMSWYGVNFLLSAGLHSYGFGTGGRVVIAVCVIGQLGFAMFVWVWRVGRSTKGAASASLLSPELS
jgi:ABC-type transport system involved in cytochrome c biogenesis permease subunit